MIPFVASTLLLVQMSAFVTGTHYCREHRPVDQQFCGNEPTVSNDPAILKWDLGIDLGYGSRVGNATLDIRKIDRAWSQTGCFNLGDPISGSGPVPASSEHTLSSVDYDSLYIARMFWVRNGTSTSYYIKDGDCYFTLQPTPSPPQNVAAVHATSSSITWTWDPPVNHGNKVTRYRLSHNGATTSGTYYQMSGLSGNSQYCFQARAVTGSGNYGYWSSSHCRKTLPATPSGPHVSIDGSTARSVRLTLTGCRSARVGPFRYIVTYRSDSGNELTVETVTSTSPPSLLTVTDLRPGKQYSFRVRCENSAGVTGPSASTTVTTSSEDTLQPRISSVVVSNSLDFADISWDAPSAVDLVSGYDVQVVAHVGGTPQSPSVYMVASRSRYSRRYRVMQSLIPETLYTFQVRARTSVGTSHWSTPVVRSTLPAVPPRINGFTAYSPTPSSIALSWNQNTATIEYYRLTLYNAETNSRVDYDAYRTVTSHTFYNLIPSTTYKVTITAVNEAGGGPAVSAKAITQAVPVPPLVDGFAASSPTPSSIALSWNQTTAAMDYYRLTLNNAEANTTENYDLFRTVTSHTFHNLSPNTAYSLTITAVNKEKSGPPDSVNVTTQGVPSAVSPLAAATGVLGAMVVIGIVIVSLLFAYTCCLWMRRKKEKHHAVPDDNNCELQENVAYVTAAHNKLWSEDMDEEEEEREKEEGCEEGNTYVKDKAMDLEPASPELPCRQYLQEKEKGQTVFASIPVLDEIDFKRKSGWYMPTVADAISMKLGMDAAAFADLGSGVYFMCHKTKTQAKWVGLSPDLCRTLCGHFFQLYHKERSQLSPIEVELKFFSPFAADWDIQVWTAEPKELVLKRAKKIVEFKTLKPLGLNNALKFTTKEMWEEFTSWFAAQKRNK